MNALSALNGEFTRYVLCAVVGCARRCLQVYKDPITDKGKQSKKGKLTLEKIGGKLVTVTEGKGTPANDVLVEVSERARAVCCVLSAVCCVPRAAACGCIDYAVGTACYCVRIHSTRL